MRAMVPSRRSLKISGVGLKIFCGGSLGTPPLACLLVRKKISGRLTKHALSEKPIMDELQVQTALTVLNKLLPDLTVTQLITDDELLTMADTQCDD
jgi:hypothetical protein